MKKCSKCNYECKDGFDFCPKCGSKLVDNNEDKSHDKSSTKAMIIVFAFLME